MRRKPDALAQRIRNAGNVEAGAGVGENNVAVSALLAVQDAADDRRVLGRVAALHGGERSAGEAELAGGDFVRADCSFPK